MKTQLRAIHETARSLQDKHPHLIKEGDDPVAVVFAVCLCLAENGYRIEEDIEG